MRSISLLLLALPVSLSFVGVGPVPGPAYAPPLSPRCLSTRPSCTTPARSFAPRTFPGVLGSTGAGRRRVWGGQVVYASSGDDDCVTQGETAAPSKEAADGPETLRTVGMTGARIDYERDATGSEKGPATAQRPRGSAGRVGSQWVVRGEGSAGGVSWRNEAAGSRNSRMVAAGRIGSAEARVARKREETLADVVRRGGSIGCGVRAVKRLVEAGVQVNGKTFSQLMKIAHEQMKRGRANLDDTADVVKLARDCGVEPDLFLYNAWLSATATAASQGKADLSDGSKVLQALRAGGIKPDIVTFNSLMHVCAMSADQPGIMGDEDGQENRVPVTPMTGYSVLQLIGDEGLEPTAVTFATLMNLCARSADKGRATVQDGRVVLERMDQAEVAPTVQVMNSMMVLVANAARHGTASLQDGVKTLALMQTYAITPNVVTYNSLLKVVASAAGRGLSGLEEARKILARIDAVGLKPDVISYNSLLDVCSKTGDVQEIHPILDEMVARGLQPDLLSYTSALRAVSKAAEGGRAGIREADAILDRMRDSGQLELDTVLCNAFLSTAAADGSPEALLTARDLLSAMRPGLRDSYTYSALLTLIGKTQGPAAAVKVLAEARDAGVRPNRYMYNAALRVCSDAGQYLSVLSIASSMTREAVRWDDLTRTLVAEAKKQAGLSGGRNDNYFSSD